MTIDEFYFKITGIDKQTFELFYTIDSECTFYCIKNGMFIEKPLDYILSDFLYHITNISFVHKPFYQLDFRKFTENEQNVLLDKYFQILLNFQNKENIKIDKYYEHINNVFSYLSLKRVKKLCVFYHDKLEKINFDVLRLSSVDIYFWEYLYYSFLDIQYIYNLENNSEFVNLLKNNEKPKDSSLLRLYNEFIKCFE